MTGLSPFPPLLDRYRNLPDPLSQRSCLRPIFDNSRSKRTPPCAGRLAAVRFQAEHSNDCWRLAVLYNGKITLYDTLDHRIGGVQQQQGGYAGFAESKHSARRFAHRWSLGCPVQRATRHCLGQQSRRPPPAQAVERRLVENLAATKAPSTTRSRSLSGHS
jgi:hypothetical protein